MVSFYVFFMKWFQIDDAVRDKSLSISALLPFHIKKFEEPEVCTPTTVLYLILHFEIYF